ncbi:MAG TPA: CAP domain-containing protein [Candidatus Acidoferrales bacterium]|nr:CAP domain-containing protein [Candidatus Acidoferrales bacterium]
MTAERRVTLLAHGAVGVVLIALVTAALSLPEPRAQRATPDPVVLPARAGAIARHLLREPDVAIASVDAATGSLDDLRVVPDGPLTPDPVVAAEPPAPEPIVAVVPAAAPVVVALRAPQTGAGLVTDDTRAAELEMLRLMNASRAAGGLVALSLDAGVSDTARAHSDVESRYGYVYHDGPDGTARSRDATACATGWYGENTGKVWNDNVRALNVEFMAEPWEPINHRTNIMDPSFRRVGVGAVLGRDAMYLTMVFCR